MIKLPELTQAPRRHKGRDVRAAYQRGWGLQFSDLAEQVRKDPRVISAYLGTAA